jgi:peroxiredoxin
MDAKGRLAAGAAFPDFTWPTVASGPLTLAREAGWRVLVVYRGRHCGACRRYLDRLNGMLDDWRRERIFVAALSADSRDAASEQARAQRWRFPVAYDLQLAQMRSLGLYVSPPIAGEVDHPFAEPATFALEPGGRVQAIDISNVPFSRPDLGAFLDGLKTARDDEAPIHGTL